jgi:hypothetical protein
MLELATKQGDHIKNRIGKDGHSQQQMSKFIGLKSRYPNARIRTENTDMYNCHGMVFACRRTNIDDPNVVKKIIQQDDYLEVEVRKVLPGDIIIYFSESGGDPEHSGIVINISDDILYIPLDISKWGQGEEYIHPANQCPYNFTHVKYYRIKI